MTAGQVDATTAKEYVACGWWTPDSVSTMVRRRAAEHADKVAYVDDHGAWSWAEYDALGDRFATLVQQAGSRPGDRVGVHLPDGALLHAAYLGCERAGVIAVGVPSRADPGEVARLLQRSGARVLVAQAGGAADDDAAASGRGRQTVLVDPDELRRQIAQPGTRTAELPGIAPDRPWLLNFTSGTTGLPKAVVQTQNRWFYLAQAASAGARIRADDVVLSAIPGPYGFGLWTAHLVPAMHGCSCAVTARFSAAEALRMIEQQRVTVLACVTTQLIMMLEHPIAGQVDLSSLRVTFTGGEKVPYDKAARWEDLTGSSVLQFYGSNEAGPFSCTRLEDDRDTRLTTAGRVVDGVDWRLLESRTEMVAGVTAEVGQATLRSPGAHGGYWEDPAANEELYTDDGYMVMPDVVAIDAEHRVRIVGRKSDIIIRGGKNISAAVVEQEVSAHPDVQMAAAVPVNDPVFGERIGVAIVQRPETEVLELAQLTDYLRSRGVSKELWPERILRVDSIPMSLGAKADKQRIRSWFTDSGSNTLVGGEEHGGTES